MSQLFLASAVEPAARNLSAGTGAYPIAPPPILVSDARPTATQRWIAWGIILALYTVAAASLPFYFVQLPPLAPFVPVVEAIVFLTAVIAAAFVFSQYRAQPRPAFLALAAGYLMGGLFAFLQSLAFPHSYSETALFGDASTPAWLFVLWRTSFAVGVLVYALAKPPPAKPAARGAAAPIAITTLSALLTPLLLTLLISRTDRYLPHLYADAIHQAAFAQFTMVPAFALSCWAIVLLARRGTMLDLWLVVTLAAALPDVIIPVSRFAVGFYLARGYELISASAVLIALLTETSVLYARLAGARQLQAQGETERMRSAEAATAAIAHEIRQPLGAIRIHAKAGVMLLDKGKATATELGEILNDIESDARRANDIIERIRGLVRRQELRTEPLDANALVTEAVKLVSEDAAARRVEIIVRPSNESVRIAGDRTQLIEVLLNLIANGMNAMDATPPSARKLTLQIARREGEVVIAVRDQGHGIPDGSSSQLFEPFFTTRKDGMGLGLAIAQSITTAHHGRITAENNPDTGATFTVALPLAS